MPSSICSFTSFKTSKSLAGIQPLSYGIRHIIELETCLAHPRNGVDNICFLCITWYEDQMG